MDILSLFLISAVLIISVVIAWILFEMYKSKIKNFFRARRLQKLKLDKSDLKDSMHDTESHFYHEGFISKNEFKRKMQKYKKKLVNLKRKEKELMKKHKE
ncbi:MAG: hypothetical protein R6U26_00330 [Candidatus Undinarchaeales archaeon]